MKPLYFVLTLTGQVSPNGEDPEATDIALTQKELQRNLHYAIQNMVSGGAITGESPATLEAYSTETVFL